MHGLLHVSSVCPFEEISECTAGAPKYTIDCMREFSYLSAFASKWDFLSSHLELWLSV